MTREQIKPLIEHVEVLMLVLDLESELMRRVARQEELNDCMTSCRKYETKSFNLTVTRDQLMMALNRIDDYLEEEEK